MKYAPPLGSSDPDTNYADPVDKTVPAAAVEQPMREIANVITGMGLVPSDTDLTQLDQAIDLKVAAMQPDLGGYVAAERTIATKAPLTGGGSLADDLTLGMAPAAEGSVLVFQNGTWRPYQLDLQRLLLKSHMPEYGTFTARRVVTESGTWTAPVTGWLRVTVVGGGGGGGGGGNATTGYGGGAGGTSSFDDLRAEGGSGGGAGHRSNANTPLIGGTGGGGGSGGVTTEYLYTTRGTAHAVSIGAGGTGGGTGGEYSSQQNAPGGEGPKGGRGGAYNGCGQGGGGGLGGQPGQGGAPVVYKDVASPCLAGHGGGNGTGYGGGGGGGASDWDTSFSGRYSYGGWGADNAEKGGDSTTSGTTATGPDGNNVYGAWGGNGGPGAVILEYQGG